MNTTDLAPPDFEGHMVGVTWRDEMTLWYLATKGTATTLSRLRVGQDPAERKVLLHTEQIGLVFDLSHCYQGIETVVFRGNAPIHPNELFVWSGKGEPRRLTDCNPWLTRYAGPGQVAAGWFDWYVRDLHPLDGPLPELDLGDRYGLELDE
ncbi:MAG: hypothetical protein ABIF77_19380 [bacterium]